MIELIYFERKRIFLVLNSGRMVKLEYVKPIKDTRQFIRIEKMDCTFGDRSFFDNGTLNLCPIDGFNFYLWLMNVHDEPKLWSVVNDVFAGAAFANEMRDAICFACVDPDEPLTRRPVGEQAYHAAAVLRSHPDFEVLRAMRTALLADPTRH